MTVMTALRLVTTRLWQEAAALRQAGTRVRTISLDWNPARQARAGSLRRRQGETANIQGGPPVKRGR